VPQILPGDWYPGVLPDNIRVDPTAYIGSSHAFINFRSARTPGLIVGRGASLCDGTILDVGEQGRVIVRDFALINDPRIICDHEVWIDAHAMIAWNAVIMDSYRLPRNATACIAPASSKAARDSPDGLSASRVHIGRYAWIGFEACILPGVTIGEGAIVGARSVVIEDVPPYAVVVGNPARLIRYLEQD
jgi:acetyltransferase-like isoleucine patch superfamily enzyme